jgi:hypothetical protein
MGEYRADLLVVILVRYFGCLPCQNYLADLDRVQDRLPDGTRMIAVGGSAAYQARWLRDTKGVRIPLLLDPEQQVRAIAGIGNLTSMQMSRLNGWKNYLRAMRHGFRPQVPTADLRKAPGIIVFDNEFFTTWVHRGEMLGDYPPVDELLATIGSLATSG